MNPDEVKEVKVPEVDPIVKRLLAIIHKKAVGKPVEEIDGISEFRSEVRKFLLMPNDELLRERSKVLMKRSNLSRSERNYCLKIGTELYFELCRLQEAKDKERRDNER